MAEIELEKIDVAKTVDARGCACPGPLLEAKKGIGAVRIGEVLEILANHNVSFFCYLEIR